MQPSRRVLRALLLALALTLPPLHATEAALMQVVLDGTIDRADVGNVLGVAAGDTFRITIDFDPSEAFGDMNHPWLVFGFQDRSTLLIQIGNRRLTPFDDFDFGDSGPAANLSADRMRIVSFIFKSFLNGDDPASGDLETDVLDIFGAVDFADGIGIVRLRENAAAPTSRITVEGRFRFVPEPAHLLGLGLALLGWRRGAARRSAS
jgi:hypothetical protein